MKAMDVTNCPTPEPAVPYMPTMRFPVGHLVVVVAPRVFPQLPPKKAGEVPVLQKLGPDGIIFPTTDALLLVTFTCENPPLHVPN